MRLNIFLIFPLLLLSLVPDEADGTFGLMRMGGLGLGGLARAGMGAVGTIGRMFGGARYYCGGLMSNIATAQNILGTANAVMRPIVSQFLNFAQNLHRTVRIDLSRGASPAVYAPMYAEVRNRLSQIQRMHQQQVQIQAQQRRLQQQLMQQQVVQPQLVQPQLVQPHMNQQNRVQQQLMQQTRVQQQLMQQTRVQQQLIQQQKMQQQKIQQQQQQMQQSWNRQMQSQLQDMMRRNQQTFKKEMSSFNSKFKSTVKKQNVYSNIVDCVKEGSDMQNSNCGQPQASPNFFMGGPGPGGNGGIAGCPPSVDFFNGQAQDIRNGFLSDFGKLDVAQKYSVRAAMLKSRLKVVKRDVNRHHSVKKARKGKGRRRR